MFAHFGENFDVKRYIEQIRKMLFYHNPHGETLDWAPENPNAPYSTRYYWEMHDSKGTTRRFCREVFHEIEVGNKKTFDNNSISRRVAKLINKQIETDEKHRQPPEHLVRFLIAKLSLEKQELRGKSEEKSQLQFYKESQEHKKAGSRTKGFFSFINPLFRKAYAELWKNREKQRRLEREHHARYKKGNETSKEAYSFINERISKSKRQLKSPYEDFDRDEIAASNQSIIGRIGRDITYLAVDKNNVGILLRWPSCLLQVYGVSARVARRAATDIHAYFSISPPTRMDPVRQPTDKWWGERNPQFDKRGVAYLGIGGETGHPHKPVAVKAASQKGIPELQRLRKDLMEGAIEVISEAHKFVLDVIDPNVVEERQAAIRKFPVADAALSPNSAHNFTAILCNVKSGTHKDTNDANFGYASLTPLGDFEGNHISHHTSLYSINKY